MQRSAMKRKGKRQKNRPNLTIGTVYQQLTIKKRIYETKKQVLYLF